MRSIKDKKPGSGFTLVEAMITLVILGMVGSTVIMTLTDKQGSFRVTSSAADLEARVRRGIDRVAGELLTAGAGQLTPDPTGSFGTSDMRFRNAVGLNGNTIEWSNQNRIAFEYDTHEVDDGLDNDGDGLIDEGNLVLTRNDGMASEVRAVLCRGLAEMLEGELANGVDDNGNGVVDEPGFSVHRVGDVLFLRLTMQDSIEQGVILTRTLETSSRLRN